MAQVKVFGSRISVYSLRVELALKLKGVDYEFNQEDLANKSPLLLKYNPVHKKIPVLVHNEKPVAESLVILEYIDETFDGPAILPADPYERAMARFWSRFFDDKVAPAIRKVCTNSGEEQEKGKEEFSELLKFLEHELEGKKFFGGNTIGFVDIAATFLSWFPVVEKLIGVEILSDDHSFPNVYNWIQEYQNSSLVKENTPSKDQLTEQFKGYLKMQSTSK